MEKVTMRISVFITWLLLHTPVTADNVTIAMLLLILIGAVLMGAGTLPLLLVGILLIHFTVILDNVDGEIARYRKQGSITGTFLEHLYHIFWQPLVYFSLAYGVFAQTGARSVLVFGFIAATFSRSLVMLAVKSAAVKNCIMDSHLGRVDKKIKDYILSLGGADKAVRTDGETEYNQNQQLYNTIKEVWKEPMNIVLINLLIIAEILNSYYLIIPKYSLLYWYVIVYGTGAFTTQIISLILNYKNKTVMRYYIGIYGKNKR